MPIPLLVPLAGAAARAIGGRMVAGASSRAAAGQATGNAASAGRALQFGGSALQVGAGARRRHQQEPNGGRLGLKGEIALGAWGALRGTSTLQEQATHETEQVLQAGQFKTL